MKQWLVRFAVLFVFNILVLLVIGWLSPAQVGWSALWAAIVLTLLTMWVRPLFTRWFDGRAAKSAHRRTKAGNAVAQVGTVLLVALIVWVLTVWLSGISAGLNPIAYIVPPIILAIGWWIYELIASRVETHAEAIYDRATGTGSIDTADAAASVGPSSGTATAQRELQDGLTDEQRKMLDDLGKA